jgi:uncharacterized membrane-anchored protein YhcB (DUF1043 family)
MLINRHNYESFFLLYVDDELSAQEKEMVDQFVADQADLKAELDRLLQTKMQASQFVAFGDFSSLLKLTTPHAHINESNCMDWLLLYVDNELNATEQNAVEAFVQLNPHYAEELSFLQSTKLSIEDQLAYGDKSDLLRKEKDDRVIPFPWWRIAAAAILIGLLFGAYFLRNQNASNEQQTIANAPVQKEKTPNIVDPSSKNADSSINQQKDLTATESTKDVNTVFNKTAASTKATNSNKDKSATEKEDNNSAKEKFAKQDLQKPLQEPSLIENTNTAIQNGTPKNVVVPNAMNVVPAPKPQYVVYNPDAKEDVAKTSKNRNGRKLKRLLQRAVLGQESTDEGEPKVTNIAFFQIETKTEEKKVEVNEQKHK